MKRDTHKTVTGFALLIPASKSEAAGEANFLPALRKQYVRIVSVDDIKKTARGLRGIEAVHFDACLSFRKVTMSGDPLAFNMALDRFLKVMLARKQEQDDIRVKWKKEEEDRDIQAGWQIHPGGRRTKQLPGGVFAEKLPGKYIEPEPEPPTRDSKALAEFFVRLFSQEITGAIFSEHDVFVENGKRPKPAPPQVVCWYFEDAFRPAIYCPDLKSALYIHTFLLAPAGGVGFRACPYDGGQFFQDRPNQEYCCPSHREAHRMARFRENKKRVTTERAKKGRKDGTQKAR